MSKYYMTEQSSLINKIQRNLIASDLKSAKQEADRMTCYHSTEVCIFDSETGKVICYKYFDTSKNRRIKNWKTMK